MIGGDSTLECAMELLTAAGKGLKDFEEEETKVHKVVLTSSSGGKFIGRHTPGEYKVYFETLTASCDLRDELEAGFVEMLPIACKWISIPEMMGGDKGDSDGGDIVGSGITILCWLMMNVS